MATEIDHDAQIPYTQLFSNSFFLEKYFVRRRAGKHGANATNLRRGMLGRRRRQQPQKCNNNTIKTTTKVNKYGVCAFLCDIVAPRLSQQAPPHGASPPPHEEGVDYLYGVAGI